MMTKEAGGTAIIVKDAISIKNPRFYNNLIQSNSIEILSGGIWYGFVSTYFPPGLQISSNVMTRFLNFYRGYILGGDFNARDANFGDTSTNYYGSQLLDTISITGGSIINTPSPTCFRCVDGSFIDKFINLSNNIPNCNINLLPSFSDHFAISI